MTPTPYYSDEWVTLYHGDASEFAWALEGEAFLTHPPYGVAGGKGGDSRRYAKAAYGAEWPDTPDYVSAVCVPLVDQLRQRTERGAVTPGVRCMAFYPAPADIGCFWTPAAVTHGPWGFTTFTPILYYGKDYRAGVGPLPSGRALVSAAPKNGHPCPKPLTAWRWLLEKVSKPGETVLDPFAGSGTTLRAAKDLGRKAIGIEIEERYCEIAAKRLAQEVLDLQPVGEDGR